MGKNNDSSEGSKTKQIKDKLQICHLCMKNTIQSAQCSIKRCKNSFCFQCIISNFNKDFKPSEYVKQCWICFSCGGSCKCLFCTGIDGNRKKKSTKLQNSQKTPQLQKVTQKKQQIANQKLIDEKSQQEKEELSQKHKRRYQRRRLPAKKKIVFKYKTKRRLRNKGSNQIKTMLNNLQEKDKILKIKREQFHKQSSQQSSQSQISGEQQNSSLSNSDLKQQKIQMSSQKQKIQTPKKKRNSQNLSVKKQHKEIDQNLSDRKSKIQSEISSSLDYLQDSQKDLPRKLRSARKSDDSEKKQKGKILQKLPTIKSIESQKQVQLTPKKVSRRGRKRKVIEQEKNSQISLSQVQQTQKVRLRRTKKQQVQKKDQKYLTAKNEQMARRGRLTRRMKKIEQNRNIKSEKRFSKIISEQQKQERPKRSTRRNYLQFQEGINELCLAKRSQRRRQKQENQMNSQNEQDSPQKELKQSNKSGEDQEVQDPSNEENQQREVDHDESEKSVKYFEQEKKKKRNKEMKKHYQEELQKNIQFQVNDSQSSVQNQNLQNQIQNQQKSQQNQQQPIQHTQKNLQNLQFTQKLSPNNLNQVEGQPFSKIQKVSESNIKIPSAKTLQESTKIYRKGPGKRNHPNTSHSKLDSFSHNQIVKKWATIPDHCLIEIRNVQRLGYQALFARQNLSKQINQLLQRRNRILNENLKNSSENQHKIQ